MEKFSTLLLGTNDVPTYFAAFAFAIIGAIIGLLIKATKRNKVSDHTPYKFSWSFLLQDNFQQLATGVLLTFIAFRFTNEFLGRQLTMWLAVLIGGGNNYLAGLFEQLQRKARKA